MKPIRVFIATTDGPAEVQRIAEEDPDVKSVVCLDGKAIALPISPDYDAFVRAPTGVIERSYGHRAFRLDVSREISNGLSWQLGLFVAHALHVAGRLAEDGTDAGEAIWLTGEVDRDLKVGPVDHVVEKLRQSRRLFAELATAGTRITVVVPSANAPGTEDTWVRQWGIDTKHLNILTIESVGDVLDTLGLRRPGIPTAGRRSKRSRGRLRFFAGAAAASVVAAIGLTAAAEWSGLLPPVAQAAVERMVNSPLPEPSATPVLDITAVETRAPEGNTCAAVQFGVVAPAVRETPLANHGRLDTTAARGLCDLRYRITNRGAPARLWVFAARGDETDAALRTKVLVRDQAMGTGKTIVLDGRPPARLVGTLDQHLVIVATGVTDGDDAKRLNGNAATLGGPIPAEAWRTMTRDLRKDGRVVVTSVHQIRP